MERPEFKKIKEGVWEISKSFKPGMRVPVRVTATKKLLDQMENGVFEQITNVAFLPGIQRFALCMPDGHWGYGFPIGGVAAFDVDEGIISPGGIGFDINCGIRLITTNLTFSEVKPKIQDLVDLLFAKVPSGLGKGGLAKVDKNEFKKILKEGAVWCVKKGFGWREDLERIEERGGMMEADPEKVSERAMARGIGQVGSLGSGNHFLEIQKVAKIFDKGLVKKMGVFSEDQITVMIHCGSRGFGHQVATDYLKVFAQAMPKYGISVPDRQLACAPFKSAEGQDYFAAMACAVNMAFANRQMIMHQVRECFSEFFGKSPEDLGMHLVYDVAHNIAKLEEYKIEKRKGPAKGGSASGGKWERRNGKGEMGKEEWEKREGKGEKRELVVHRKGATRALGPGNPKLPKIYQETGQPVIIGGSMESASYLLVGTKKAEEETFGSTCHGSGRTMSRTKAKKQVWGGELQKQMREKGIYVKTSSFAGLAEEAGLAYKDIDEVIKAVSVAGISKPVACFSPIGNIKG